MPRQKSTYRKEIEACSKPESKEEIELKFSI